MEDVTLFKPQMLGTPSKPVPVADHEECPPDRRTGLSEAPLQPRLTAPPSPRSTG